MGKLTKSFLVFLMCLIFIGGFSCVISAEDEYYVADVSSGKIEKLESFESFYYANNYYLNNLNKYDNLVLYEGEKVLKMEYGIVEFMTDDACSLNMDYRSITRNSNTSINGCYGIDAAYLDSSYDGRFVYFKYAGDKGYANKDDVILHPYELLDQRISSYANINGTFNHKIKTQLNLDYYAYVLEIDKELPYLNSDKDYYSYDGHYFYDDFYLMIDDYQNDKYENAINADNPYFNYYSYLPQRSLTNYEYQEIEDYFTDTLKISGRINYYDDQAKDNANDVVNRSQYYGNLKSFYEYQNIYGVNALMSLAVSINESAYGKNNRAYVENNVFLHTAYDSNEERKNNRYESVDDSIYSYVKYYVSDRYCNYRSSLYNGSYYGNKLSGMNVEYSLDPYWGEKAANNYFKLDQKLGFKDYNQYTLGIIQGGGTIRFYNDEELKRTRFTISNVHDYSLILLEEKEGSYKVQVDPSFSDEYRYDFNNSVAYIPKEYVDYIINEENIHQNDLITVTFDGNGGLIDGKEELKLKVLKGHTPIINNIKYDGYEFIGFDSDLEVANKEKTYVANYKKIESISLGKGFNYNIELGSYFNLKGAYIVVNYEDGTKKNVEINTDMLSGVNVNEDAKQSLIITYNGVSTNIDVNVSRDLKMLNEQTKSLIDKNITSYKNNGTYDKKEIATIKNNLRKIDYVYDFDEIRLIDKMLLKENEELADYHIDKNDYDLSVSGLALSLAENKRSIFFIPFINTYYVYTKTPTVFEQSKLAEVGEAYGFEAVDYLNITFSLNYRKVELDGAIVVSVKLPDKQNNKTYSVYRLDENGDVVKCKTTQSNSYIQFLTKKSGNFVILAKDSVNSYNINDFKENITVDNADNDNHGYFILGAIGAVLIVYGLILVIVYFNAERKQEKIWKDYKKSLLKADFVQEEKPKN